MKAWLWKHRAVVGYLALIVIVVVAIELHHNETTAELDQRDRVSCEQRNALAANQRIVLHTLSILIELDQSEQEHSPFEKIVLERSLEQVQRARTRAAAITC